MALRRQPQDSHFVAPRHTRAIDFAAFRGIADEVGAWLLADVAHTIGLMAGGALPSAVPYADVVTFTTHKALRGPRGGGIMCTQELAARIDRAVFPFVQGGPLMHAIAAKAVAFGEALQPEFARVRAAGGGQRPGADRRPGGRGHAARLRGHGQPSGVDRPAGRRVSGAVAEQRCSAAGITLNRNAIPYDPEPPTVTSGIRVGTPPSRRRGWDPRGDERGGLDGGAGHRAQPGQPPER